MLFTSKSGEAFFIGTNLTHIRSEWLQFNKIHSYWLCLRKLRGVLHLWLQFVVTMMLTWCSAPLHSTRDLMCSDDAQQKMPPCFSPFPFLQLSQGRPWTCCKSMTGPPNDNQLTFWVCGRNPEKSCKLHTERLVDEPAAFLAVRH